MADINKIKERVQALLAKAMDAASSENEATAAYEAAQKLMSKYRLSQADLDAVGENDFKSYDVDGKPMKSGKGYVYHPVDKYLGTTIAQFTGTRFYFYHNRAHCKFFGLIEDVEFVSWMRQALIAHFDKGWADYKDFGRKNKRIKDLGAERQSFSVGFADAIKDRLDNWMFRTTDDDTEFALTCKRADIVTDELARRGVRLGTMGPRRSLGISTQAAGAGRVVGDSATLGRGVGSGGRVMLGHSPL